MILLKQKEGIKDRIIHGVAFVDGKAELHDHLKQKAEFICKRYNVTMSVKPEVKKPVGVKKVK